MVRRRRHLTAAYKVRGVLNVNKAIRWLSITLEIEADLLQEDNSIKDSISWHHRAEQSGSTSNFPIGGPKIGAHHRWPK